MAERGPKGSCDHILNNVHLVHVLKFRLRHLPLDLSSVYTQLPQIIHIHRICQLNLSRAASISAMRVTCPIHCILLDFIALSHEKQKLCRSPFYTYILRASNYVRLVREAAGVQNKKSTENMDFINNSRRICRNGKTYSTSETLYFYPGARSRRLSTLQPATKVQRGSRGITVLFL